MRHQADRGQLRREELVGEEKWILKKLKLRMPTDHQPVVAMPAICCGLDRKNFGKTKNQALHNIKKIIKEIFDDTDLTIIIIIDKQWKVMSTWQR